MPVLERGCITVLAVIAGAISGRASLADTALSKAGSGRFLVGICYGALIWRSYAHL